MLDIVLVSRKVTFVEYFTGWKVLSHHSLLYTITFKVERAEIITNPVKQVRKQGSGDPSDSNKK